MPADTHLPWLLDGDPAIRWQTRRDLLDEPPDAYELPDDRVHRIVDYFRWVGAPRDERMADAIALLRGKQTSDSCWKLSQNWPGRVLFEMEKVGLPSRWNTLTGLRVLRWWEGRSNETVESYHEIPA
jgi:hypothetical protein